METNTYKKIIRFEDLEVWKWSMELCKEIFNISNEWKGFSLKEQIQRSALSIPSNISEGFERNTNKELIQFLYYAKGSAGELRTQIYLAKELNLIEENKSNEMIIKVKKISAMLYNFIESKKQNLKV